MTTKRIRDLVIGDMVDLEGDLFADRAHNHPAFESEYQTVASIDHETENCIAVGFEGFDVVGFPPDHTVIVEEGEPESYTLEQIMEAAKSLMPDPEDRENREYARGICELIGRLRLDFGGHGEGTCENAIEVAKELGARIFMR